VRERESGVSGVVQKTVRSSQPPIIVVMGVTGSGKTTIGRLLATELAVPFVDADDFHSAENIARMRRGEPLDDEARDPWLDRLNAELRRYHDGAVMACSALTQDYRDRLTKGIDDVHFVLLTAPPDILRARIEARTGHFAPADLLPSQLALLEQPKDAIVVDVTPSPDVVIQQIVSALRADGR
jgi:gluconokinase